MRVREVINNISSLLFRYGIIVMCFAFLIGILDYVFFDQNLINYVRAVAGLGLLLNLLGTALLIALSFLDW
jgi:nitrate reductase gamma subunit